MIADLEALLAKAPGEWRIGPENYADIYGPDGDIVALVPKGFEWTVAVAQQIAATHNALPAILTVLRKAEALCATQRQCWCTLDDTGTVVCVFCALRLALAALAEGPRS